MTRHTISLRLTHPLGGGWMGASRRRWRRLLRRAEVGMTTAEYAVGIMAACTFALVLLGVVRSDAVRGALAGLVQSALGIAG
ncbi:DUF4244 domain-containing protein [Humibacillus xanthopallidus]|uniref:Uncharacterized protein DUF4244 n=1 Tax=Humibacillus xanthopallidus TaxID=412689 RepID=A0A543I1P8_9MICO|nr:DUF4244 domain-containing protein [Humibacillus xanthopallidus]TQM64512.1 uncharacterized protein DUF4244 [Humibacillus xanthopallidus]